MTWWRQQRVALVALAVAAVTAVGVYIWLDVIPVTDDPPPTPTVVEGSVSTGGNTLEFVSATSDEFPAPDAAWPLSIRLRASSDAEATMCGSFTLSEVDGDRVWRPAGSEVDVEYGDEERSCSEGMDAYGILTVFLLPDDADRPFWFDVTVDDEVVRFRID